MIASFHLAEYRRRSFSLPKWLSGQVEGCGPDLHRRAFYAAWAAVTRCAP